MKYLLLIMIALPMSLFPQSIVVFNATSVVDIIEKASSKIKSFKGKFVYKKDKNSYSGYIIYVVPNKLLMQFGTESDPIDKKIVSDGKFIWIQEGDLIARQKMGESTNPLTGWNIQKLKRQYIATAPRSGLEIKYGSIPAYQIIFEPKINTTSFRSIDMIVDKEGLIRRVKATSRVGNVTELTLSYSEFNKEYGAEEFIVNTTEESQIYDNIFE
ncbi:MAG: outer membrane lipoprotein carrier protein LolA [Spirochaetota bacterium]|nr:outer membrane lipoprotein carrier protein LolA [Spirochaetota bacterium]